MLLAVAVALSGCFQTQLNGPVAGAEITLTALDNPALVLFTGITSDRAQVIEEYGDAAWTESSTIQKLLSTGVVRLPESDLDMNSYYLLTAHGGRNRDPGAQLRYLDQAHPVNGSWHAILPPHRIGHENNRISLLTEASYQWLLRENGGSLQNIMDLPAQLDRVARRAVGDLDLNGKVDYDDLLSWDIYAHKTLYRGNFQLLQHLDLALSLNSSPDIVRKFALQVIDGTPATD